MIHTFMLIVKAFDNEGNCVYYNEFEDEIDYNAAIAYCESKGYIVDAYCEYA